MRPLVAGADPNFEGFTLLHGIDAALSQDGPMEEGVAGPIQQFGRAPRDGVRAAVFSRSPAGLAGRLKLPQRAV